MICPTGEAKYFLRQGWTRLFQNSPTDKSVRAYRARGLYAPDLRDRAGPRNRISFAEPVSRKTDRRQGEWPVLDCLETISKTGKTSNSVRAKATTIACGLSRTERRDAIGHQGGLRFVLGEGGTGPAPYSRRRT